MSIAAVTTMGLLLLGQGKAEPRLACPQGSTKVELPAPSGGKVLRCVDDATGNPHGPEVWLRANSFFWIRGRWDQGKRHGSWARWYPSGHLMSQVDYNQGRQLTARCLTEQKRRTQTCTPDWMPLDWKPPAEDDANPAIVPIPVTPSAGG